MQHKARKRFGQNFLTQQNIIQQIIQTIAVQKQDHIVEIGPGKGALTTHLIRQCQFLTAIELDRDLIPLLKITLATQLDKLNLINEDALRLDYSALCKEQQKLRLIGNLPYNISTPILFHLLTFRENISDMFFMLQDEVVERLTAKPGSKNYGRLSIMMQYFCQVEKHFVVPPEAFSPVPKVNSAIVSLTPYQDVEAQHQVKLASEERLAKVCKLAFQQRRKTIRNNLKEVISDHVFEDLGIDPSCRSETLLIKDFINLANHLETILN